MASENTLAMILGGFGLGLGAALLFAALVGRQVLQFLSTFSPWTLRGAAFLLAASSIAMILIAIGGGPGTAPGTATAGPAPKAPDATQGAAGSMEAATEILAARLGAKSGSDADWNLLAQSYDFLGRPDQAQLARQHKVSAQRSLTDAMVATAPLAPPSTAMSATMPQSAVPDAKVAALLAKAEEHRRKREFKQACDVYRSIIAAHGMTADAWADYADALASGSAGGSLVGEPARAIDQALALDPRQTKALWLKASLALEEHQYQDALVTWRTLLALMPAGSSDAKIIESNITEAQRLAGPQG